MLKKLELQPVKPPNPKYIPKPYEKMQYPGQRVQIDVKFVPDACIVGDAKSEGRKFYQYTAIDEYSRFRYLEAFEEHSSYSSAVFLDHILKAFKFKAECIQTDNTKNYIILFCTKYQLFYKLSLLHRKSCKYLYCTIVSKKSCTPYSLFK